jgi:CelD/BcsL family acetyltransferase involved in cellulose biosynthesis
VAFLPRAILPREALINVSPAVGIELSTQEIKLATSRLELSIPLAADAAAWDDFVDQHPEGRFAQLWGFREVLERTYGYRSIYRKILLDGQWVGIFPAVAAGRGSRRLISQPFNEYGGPLSRDLSSAQLVELAKIMFHLSEEEKCSSIEIRGGIGCEAMAESEFCKRHHLHSYAVLQLCEKDRLWKDTLTNEPRKAVKRSQKAGLQVEVLRGGSAIAAPFYDLYLVSMKRLGVPPHPADFFKHLASGFGERLVSAAVTHQNCRIAYLLGVVTGNRIQVYITASDPEAWSLRPNDLAHWELMNWAFAAGIHVFDFGSARYAGQIHFKQKWGATFHEYSYYLIGPPNSELTSRVHSVDSSSKLMAATANLWRRFVPLRMTAVLGRPIRRFLTK